MTSPSLIHINLPARLQGTISLPTSKSISARALTISALTGGTQPQGLSDCDDTHALQAAIAHRPAIIDIGAAGTAMRFGTALFACTPGEHVLTGSPRMLERPIGLLVDALRSLGADITYEGTEGFPPLRVKGHPLKGGHTTIPASVSSQYISALLMIAPTMTEGLTLTLEGEIASRPYIDMTLAIMKAYGAQADWTAEGQAIRVAAGGYRPTEWTVEPDWSAASYWYEMVALSDDAEACICLKGLRAESLQGDSCISQIFLPLGVKTTFTDEGAVLTKTAAVESLDLDFTHCPDLTQTVVATCAMMGVAFHFNGLKSLKIKETDRIVALQTELRKLGVEVAADNESMTLTTDAAALFKSRLRLETAQASTPIATYADHRMALAFAPCAYRFPGLAIAHPEVVSKSYPAFWADLERVGATIEKA